MSTKARPILFSSPMINALLDGRKTQTRRIVKPPRQWPENSHPDPFAMPPAVWWWNGKHHRVGVRQECPYGSVGDLIWVREAFAPLIVNDWPNPVGPVIYRAEGTHEEYPGRWIPSIHMARRFSRLTLRITDVRVQRLQEISEADAQAEGLEAIDFPYGRFWRNYLLSDSEAQCSPMLETPRESFLSLWDSINARRGYGWDVNPWIWALSFDVIHANVDQVPREPA